jgi:hypothetical protein
MKKQWMAGMLLAIIVASATGLRAQTTSELLQKGIYMQETVGDLDGAIKLYRQVVDMTKDSRANAAQALYRLGVCLQKKGQTAEAGKVFHQLIQHYSEQTELVANARQALGSESELLPAPWVDGEVLELAVTMGSGKSFGVLRYSIQSSKSNPGNWVIENRLFNPGFMQVTQTEVDKETMKPVSGRYNTPAAGLNTKITYQASEALVEPSGKPVQHLALKDQVWDNEEAWAAVRRLPLAPGYDSSFSVVTPTGGVLKVSLAVSGIEEVETPAGNFHCYKVQLSGPVNQTLWYSSDAARTFVKLDNGIITAELNRAPSQIDQAPTTYHNDELGFSLSLPSGWIAEPSDLLSSKSKQKYAVQLVKLDSMAVATLTVKPRTGHVPTVEAMRADEEKDLRKEATEGGDFTGKLRPDSWQTRQIDGHPALSWIEDASNPVTSRSTVEYTVKIKSETLNAEAEVKADPKEFDAFRAAFDPILDTLKLK